MSKKIGINLKRPHVFVPMSADIIHHGHINILKKSKKYGSLIVGLMTDRGIKSYKKKLPFMTYKVRKIILQSIKYGVISTTSTPTYLLITFKIFKC